MFPLLRKIHMYVGLLGWSVILVMGIAGLDAVLSSALKATGTAPRTRTMDFVAPPDLNDAQLAEAVGRKMQLPFAPPTSYYNLHRDNAGHVCFENWTLSKGNVKVTIFEDRRQVEIEEENPGLWLFLNNLHTVTMAGQAGADWRLRYRSYYTEFGIWTLLALTITGVWQWLASRPGHRWAQVALVIACVTFAALYAVTR